MGLICYKISQRLADFYLSLSYAVFFPLRSSTCLIAVGGVTADGRRTWCLVCFTPGLICIAAKDPCCKLLKAFSCNSDDDLNYLKVCKLVTKISIPVTADGMSGLFHPRSDLYLRHRCLLPGSYTGSLNVFNAFSCNVVTMIWIILNVKCKENQHCCANECSHLCSWFIAIATRERGREREREVILSMQLTSPSLTAGGEVKQGRCSIVFCSS